MFPAAVLLSGCGLDISSEDDNASTQSSVAAEPTVQIAGAAMKGVIQQGLVVANRLIADKDGYYAPQRQAAKPVLTADDGSYEWQLRGKAEGWALVELTADGGTRMICDVVPSVIRRVVRRWHLVSPCRWIAVSASLVPAICAWKPSTSLR